MTPGQAADEASERVVSLAGMREIAERLGVPRTTASMWYSRRETTGFPEALEELAMGPVFDWDAVKTWHEERWTP